jgi:site-specific DNA-methyltransferase (adenine-specific)
MREEAGGKQMKSVWRFPAPRPEEKRLGRHPTQKPLALVARCLRASTREGDFVLDPFLGSGTTALAAFQTGRRCLGIELDDAHFKLAVRRLEQARRLGPNPASPPCPADPTLS